MRIGAKGLRPRAVQGPRLRLSPEAEPPFAARDETATAGMDRPFPSDYDPRASSAIRDHETRSLQPPTMVRPDRFRCYRRARCAVRPAVVTVNFQGHAGAGGRSDARVPAEYQIQSHNIDAGTFRPDQANATPDLAFFVAHIRDLPEILRANIYAPDRSVLWSTDAAVINSRFDDNDEFEEAFSGRTVSEACVHAGDTEAEHVALAAAKPGYYIEAYIPLRGKGGVIAVVELYKLPVTLDAVLRRGRRIVWTDMAVGALVLFGTLYTIVERAARLIERQQTEISHMAGPRRPRPDGRCYRAQPAQSDGRHPFLRRTADAGGPAAADIAGDIIGEVDYLERCVRQLLEFTRTEAVSPQQVDPLMLVNDILRQQRRSLVRDGIVVTVEDRRQTKRSVKVDPLLIRQAMTSIIVNAREAMEDGRVVAVQLYDLGPRLYIAYTDSGPGHSAGAGAADRRAVLTTKTRGLGLGLVLAKRIVERLGGSLEISNAVGRGARVQIELAMV